MKLKKFFLKWSYNNAGKDFFILNKNKISAINFHSLNILNNVAVFIFGFFCIYSQFTNLEKLFNVYLIYFIIFIIINLLYKHVHKHGFFISNRNLYFVITLLYIYGIYIGCFNLPNLTSVMYPVFVICIPLLFILPTIQITLYTLIFTIFYITFSKMLKSNTIACIDMTNIIACLLISAITSYTVTCARITEIRTNMKLEHACNTDEITGLHNRRSFNNFIVNQFDTIHNDCLTLMMIDVDNFKNYNDSYGHICGDNCLSTIGQLFKQFEEDNSCYIARYGGEEFVLVDSKHALSEVIIFARNLIQKVNELNIENINSPYKRITISIGISSRVTSDVKNYIDLINLADDALYSAKSNGKNTLMIATHSI